MGARDRPAILLVDDEEVILDATGEMLEVLGYRAVRARSGGEALALAEAERPLALAIIDYALPDMSGVELFRRLRLQSPDLAGILASGFGKGDIAAPSRPGFAAVLYKPYGLRDMERAVTEALGGA